MRSRVRGALALTIVLGLVGAACGDDDDGDGACPKNLVIQTDWWPEVEHGGTYQLIGTDGEVDTENFTYSGPIDPKYAVGGIETVEVRAGGDAIEFQPVSAVMKTDQDITLGYVNTDDAFTTAGTVAVTGVATTLEVNPQMLMWDPEQTEVDPADPSSIKASGKRVLHFPSATYIDWLIAEGDMDASQSDPNYGGAPDQWIEAGGDFIQQGFASNEVYKYENEIDWKDGAPAPVDFVLLHDLGWQPYPAMYSVLTERMDELTPCLEVLVPMLQQAWVDFLADPQPISDKLIEITEGYNNYWTLSPELNAEAVRLLTELGLADNGPDDTYGNFDPQRVQTLLDAIGPVLEAQSIELPDGYTAEDVYTNQFIDTSIGVSS